MLGKAKRIVDALPAFVAVLLFGVPFLIVEVGSFFSVVAMAMGHWLFGAILYVGLKVAGLASLGAIFAVTRAKLMTVRGFAFLHDNALRARKRADAFRRAALAGLARRVRASRR